MQLNPEVLSVPKRNFVDTHFQLNTWEALKPYYDKLLNAQPQTPEDWKNWILQRSELESFLEEDMAKRYINSTCDTQNEEFQKAFSFFIEEIEPQIAPLSNQLDKKLVTCPFLSELGLQGLPLYYRSVTTSLKLFREENIPLQTKLQALQQQFGQINAAMTIEWEGKTLTLQQASVLLQETDKELRKAVYDKVSERRAIDREKLDALMSELVTIRDEVAKNAGYENYRDYAFDALGRFDYTKEACFQFHIAVEEKVKPLMAEILKERKQKLGVESLKPYDLSVDVEGKAPLKPFSTGEELLQKTKAVLAEVYPSLDSYLTVMKEMNRLDLESRIGKAPGGYNYPLDETGVPFIFMNATSTVRDMVTLLHEAGHAIHSFSVMDLPLQFSKHTPSEAAELASMSMELLSMDYWHHYFSEADELKRAKIDHLESVLETLPWVATIDAFQHWMYENPKHSAQERTAAWEQIYNRFNPSEIDWEGYESNRAYMWQKQLHLYEVPFYYIEYAFAQLGAIAVWRNYKKEGNTAVEKYLSALKAGYTVSLPEIYELAGITFNFSPEYVDELMLFVKAEMAKA